MRLRVVTLPADAYMIVIDEAETLMNTSDRDWFTRVGDSATERSDGACHGVLFFSQTVELE